MEHEELGRKLKEIYDEYHVVVRTHMSQPYRRVIRAIEEFLREIPVA